MENRDKPIRVAQIMGKYVGGGVESIILNYYRHIDKNKVQFDFIFDEDSTLEIPKEEIENMGGRVFICPPYQKLKKYIKFLVNLFKENKYEIVHSNINTLSVFPLYAAKKAGVKVRIAHSHSTSNKKEWKKNILKNILRPWSKRYANVYFACSELAGRYQFGNRTFEKGKVKIINNAIELERFQYDENKRNEIRDELNIENDTLVIGHIGRFIQQKNHEFLIDVFKKVHDENNNSVLLLVGQGDLHEKIKTKVDSLGLNDYVKFLGWRKDVDKLYLAMDIFCLPSLYEGLGMVLIEAQTSGLKCIASINVPDCAKVTENVEFLELQVDEWKNKIKELKEYFRKSYISEITEQGYEIRNETRKLEEEYLSEERFEQT